MGFNLGFKGLIEKGTVRFSERTASQKMQYCCLLAKWLPDGSNKACVSFVL